MKSDKLFPSDKHITGHYNKSDGVYIKFIQIPSEKKKRVIDMLKNAGVPTYKYSGKSKTFHFTTSKFLTSGKVSVAISFALDCGFTVYANGCKMFC